MKNNKLIAILCALLTITGCDVIGNVDDLSHYSPDNVWEDESLANAYLNNLYASTFDGWPRDGGNADECTGILGQSYVSANTSSFKYWPYTNIRKINVLLKNIETSSLKSSIKDPIKGQALFMRAFEYFKAVKYHGGVPIIKVPQELTDDLYVTRNSTAECFDFIISDLDEAAQLLPDTYTGSDYGRISKSAVLAFKGRVLLYKASPQFNPSNPYDNQYWEDAYEANKEAYEFLVDKGFGLVDNYTDVFETDNHEEAILPIVYINPSKTDGRGEAAVRPLSESKNATGADMPIWQFVEAFPMKDGKKIGESTKYPYDVQTYWENRDPRFDQVIVYNGAIYELSGKTGRRQYTAGGIASELDAGALSLSEALYTRPGVYCKKGIQEELLSTEIGLNDVDWLEIRFAEVMFNYAEAANEMGNTDIGYQMLKEIRARAGIEPGDDGMYGLDENMTREEMRTALLDEKRIEFCFEGQRFWDLRRHRLLSELNGMHKYGIWATLKSGIDVMDARQRANEYTLMPDEFDYEVVDLWIRNTAGEAAMYTPDSYYFFPIPLSEIEKNPNLEQNKDWGGTFDPVLE
jgi:hypothetical protein